MSEDWQMLNDELLPLITERQTHPKKLYPLSIWKVVEINLLDRDYNTFAGCWFIWVLYNDGLSEVWFAVNASRGLSDDNWYLEKIT